ncbi:MAG TPA: hypothetical protein VGN23_14765 [Verrucomicrobiae bacterium]|jgi:hypothetical protein
MKLLNPAGRFSRNSDFAFTAIEMLISTTIIMMTVIALVSTEIYGTRVYTLAATQLTATDSARNALDKLRVQIQEANGILDVGNYVWANGSPTNFQSIGYGINQVGNAIRIQSGAESGTNFVLTGPYTLIFLQPASGGTNFATTGASGNLINTNNLMMETFDTNYNPVLTNTLASYITNQQVFTATDYTGTNILTNSYNNRVIQITLMFSQWEYPIAIIGTNDINAYNYYRLQTRVTRRALNF